MSFGNCFYSDPALRGSGSDYIEAAAWEDVEENCSQWGIHSPRALLLCQILYVRVFFSRASCSLPLLSVLRWLDGWLVTTMRIFILFVLIECASLLESHLWVLSRSLYSFLPHPPLLQTMNSLMNFSLLHNKHPTARSCEVYKEHRFAVFILLRRSTQCCPARLVALLFFLSSSSLLLWRAEFFYRAHQAEEWKGEWERSEIWFRNHCIFYRFFLSSLARLIFRTELDHLTHKKKTFQCAMMV